MNEIRAKCGTRCDKCDFRERFGCKGCPEMLGKPFWGECKLYACAAQKEYAHCGDCDLLPCRELQEAIRNGHQPDRLENLIRWRDDAK